ncbi:hypothetical protein [Rhodococcus qingshengii]|uniref:hypothetical protein n=1 Tax=Rhodococcus qingshengii TaxID=334542 RepID=UPI0035E2A915
MEKVDESALAEGPDDSGEDTREGVQVLTDDMIREWALSHLPPPSATAFTGWIWDVWLDWNECGDKTNGQVLYGALADWRGDGFRE